MQEETKKGEIVIYKAPEGPEIKVQMDGETVWLSAGTDGRAISEGYKNVINPYTPYL